MVPCGNEWFVLRECEYIIKVLVV